MNNISISFRDTTNRSIISDMLLCAASLLLFAWLVEYAFPLKIIALAPLLVCALIISKQTQFNNQRRSTIQQSLSWPMVIRFIIAVQLGVAGAIFYRGRMHLPLMPVTLTAFVFTAVPIAVTEELLFRGFIQTRLEKINTAFAILFAALAHASYKACLFLSPAATQHISIAGFFTWSLFAFIILGILKSTSRSVLPAIIAHAVFDILVYAEMTQAPWWVW